MSFCDQIYQKVFFLYSYFFFNSIEAFFLLYQFYHGAQNQQYRGGDLFLVLDVNSPFQLRVVYEHWTVVVSVAVVTYSSMEVV